MSYKALTVIGLPVTEEREVWKGITAQVPTGEILRKEPGDSITKKELLDSGHTEEEIAAMIDRKEISDDKDAVIHKDHWPVSADGKRTLDPRKETP